MSISLAPARPPFVEFKRVAQHDPKASVEAGYHKTRDVDVAYIMQPGSKDVHEKKAVEWLESIKRKGLEGAADAMPPEWIDGFHKKYSAWKEGLEPPIDGTSVREWSYLSPAQVENLISIRVLSIEDCAAMTEEAMGRFGMGGRQLRDKAREWLKGKEISQTVMQENDALKKQLAELADRLAQLETPVEKPKRGRPKLAA
jgi:hypothetical protein